MNLSEYFTELKGKRKMNSSTAATANLCTSRPSTSQDVDEQHEEVPKMQAQHLFQVTFVDS